MVLLSATYMKKVFSKDTISFKLIRTWSTDANIHKNWWRNGSIKPVISQCSPVPKGNLWILLTSMNPMLLPDYLTPTKMLQIQAGSSLWGHAPATYNTPMSSGGRCCQSFLSVVWIFEFLKVAFCCLRCSSVQVLNYSIRRKSLDKRMLNANIYLIIFVIL